MELKVITEKLEASTQEAIKSVYFDVFEEKMPDSLLKHMNNQTGLLALLAYEGNELIGYKIGCINLNGCFYSWLGAVAKAKRRMGDARLLLREQHKYITQNGHSIIETEAAAGNQAMLILNLQEGFQVIGANQGNDGNLIVKLRKKL